MATTGPAATTARPAVEQRTPDGAPDPGRAATGVSVRRVLDFEAVRRGDPFALTGEVGLDNQIRWVHVSELPDISHLLRGQELILTTGIALPDATTELIDYIDSLADAKVSGVMIELGRRFSDLPQAIVDRATERGLPLIVLRREVQFVHVTEQVHEFVLDQQLEVLRTSEQIHRTFTELSTEGASPQQIVSEISRLAGAPVVLENLAHQVLAYSDPDKVVAGFLEQWERTSRRLRNRERTEILRTREDASCWIASDVSARGERWGRLLMRVMSEPNAIQIGAIERGATALAVNRLVDRDRESLERQSHRTLLHDIRAGTYSSPASLSLNARNLGVPLTGRMLAGIVVSIAVDDGQELLAYEARGRDYAELIASAAQGIGRSALVGVLRPGLIGVVLSLADDDPPGGALTALAREIHRQALQYTPTPTTRIGVGSIVDNPRDLRRSLIEAEQVVSAAAGIDDDKLYFAMPDIRIRGFLYLLRDDPRLQLFIERELSPLLAHDEHEQTTLTDVLRVYLESSGNKSAAAQELGMSRPALYQRLERIERILDVRLDSSDSNVSLQVALLALDVMRASRQQGSRIDV